MRPSGPAHPGRQIESGVDLFEFLTDNPQAAAIFDAAMAERTAAYAPSVADTYDFSDIRTLTDLGGGNGTLLVEILRRHRHLSGVLFEIPTVAARADAVLAATDLADRCTILAGDFFQSVPSADCYLLANVLHDWDDTPFHRHPAQLPPGHARRRTGLDRRAAHPRGRQ